MNGRLNPVRYADCTLAAALCRSLELPADDVRAGLYTALLLHVGCVGYAHETAAIFGDEFVTQVAAERTNLADPRDVATTLVPVLHRGAAAAGPGPGGVDGAHGAGAALQEGV